MVMPSQKRRSRCRRSERSQRPIARWKGEALNMGLAFVLIFRLPAAPHPAEAVMKASVEARTKNFHGLCFQIRVKAKFCAAVPTTSNRVVGIAVGESEDGAAAMCAFEPELGFRSSIHGSSLSYWAEPQSHRKTESAHGGSRVQRGRLGGGNAATNRHRLHEHKDRTNYFRLRRRNRASFRASCLSVPGFT